MKPKTPNIRHVHRDRKGITAIEYALLAAATIIVGMAAFGAIGTSLTAVFGQYGTALAQ